ncbi:hypothetical protein [Nitrosomonas halophila]|nr:hypothetical protein [Nitrosomonas halophila]HRQ05067.1 hypothetical protein [Nitrosomonas halophila]
MTSTVERESHGRQALSTIPVVRRSLPTRHLFRGLKIVLAG